jgi:hypothetical protein
MHNCGSFGDDRDRGDRVMAERNGHPVAAVVPISVYSQWKRSRARFVERLRQASERVNSAAEDRASDAVTGVRAARQASGRNARHSTHPC